MELSEAPDLWPIVREHLLEITQLPVVLNVAGHQVTVAEAEIEEKYRRGEAEHQRDWLEWQAEDFNVAQLEEAIDLLLYAAMRRTLGC